jgi:hypothetical protein
MLDIIQMPIKIKLTLKPIKIKLTLKPIKIKLTLKPNWVNSQVNQDLPSEAITSKLVTSAKIKIALKSKLTAHERWVMIKQRFKKGSDAIKSERRIESWARLDGTKRGKNKELQEYRSELAFQNKSICFGPLCKGQIYDTMSFAKNKSYCKTCWSYKMKDYCQKNNGSSHQIARCLLKYGKSCVVCGCTDRNVLEFDHIDPNQKKYTISQMRSSRKIQIEANKCQILCTWCHRLRSKTQSDMTYVGSNKHRVVIKEFIDGVKLSIGSCQLCDKIVLPEETCCFDFDHLETDQKIDNISAMASKYYGINDIIDEIHKCWLLCCICHKLKTNIQGNYRLDRRIILKLKSPVVKFKCLDCSSDIHFGSKRCVPCQSIANRIVKTRPTYEQLNNDMIELKTYLAVAKKYGVTDAAIRKWIKMEESNMSHEEIQYYLKCRVCGCKVNRGEINCNKCAIKLIREVMVKPTIDQLKSDLIDLKTHGKVSKKYGVCITTIRRWMGL